MDNLYLVLPENMEDLKVTYTYSEGLNTIPEELEQNKFRFSFYNYDKVPFHLFNGLYVWEVTIPESVGLHEYIIEGYYKADQIILSNPTHILKFLQEYLDCFTASIRLCNVDIPDNYVFPLVCKNFKMVACCVGHKVKLPEIVFGDIVLCGVETKGDCSLPVYGLPEVEYVSDDIIKFYKRGFIMETPYFSTGSYVKETYVINNKKVQIYCNPGFGDDEDYPMMIDGKYSGFTFYGVPSAESLVASASKFGLEDKDNTKGDTDV